MRLLAALAAGLLLAALPLSGALASAPAHTGSNDLGYVDSVAGVQGSVQRLYYTGMVPSSFTGPPKQNAEAGILSVVSFNPAGTVEQSQLDTFTAWCKSAVADGYAGDVRVTVWHEANLHHTLSDWLATYAAYQKIASANGISFGVIFDTYDFNHGMSLYQWMPPASTVSFLGVDLYPRDNSGTFESPLYQLRNDLAWTAQYHKPLDIAEVGIEAKRYGTPASNAGASNYLLGLEQLPSRTHWVMWFQGDGIDLGAHGAVLAPAWRQLSDYMASR